MAAFSTYQDYNMNPFLVDSVYLKIMSGIFMEDESNMAMNTNCLSQIYPQAEPVVQDAVHETSSCHDQSSKVALSHDDDEPSVTRKQSSESSNVLDKLESGEQVSQQLSPIHKKRKTRNGSGSGSSSNSAQSNSKDGREEKGKKKQKQSNGEAKEKNKKKAAAATSEAPSGYIHVRARRGQATDSHSLAERVRREKISERMQTLQRLVPGCDKVTGKALMLDEIINYVQSLQNQVDFLSMKLASVNPTFYDFSLEHDPFMDLSPDQQRLNSMHASPLPQCSPNQPTVFDDTPPTISYNNPVDTSAFSQDDTSLLWDGDEEQGEKFLNPSGFDNNLCSFRVV